MSDKYRRKSLFFLETHLCDTYLFILKKEKIHTHTHTYVSNFASRKKEL